MKAFREVFGNPGLRRIQLAWAGSIIGTWAYGIAIAVYAYQQGGATAVGSRARVLPDGRAVAPQAAPQIVRDIINAGNVIETYILFATVIGDFK